MTVPPTPPVLDGADRDGSAPSPTALARAHDAASALRDRGAVVGTRVAVGPATAAEDAVSWVLGADLLGAATLVEAGGWSARERDAVLADAAPHVRVDGPPPAGRAAVVAHPGDDVLFYLPTTSGSGDRPAVLARSRRSWRIGFALLGPLPGPVLLPGPPASSLFLFGALHALSHGLDVRWRPHLRAGDVLDAGTVHLVPAVLTALLDELEHHPRPVGLRVVVCGGAHVGDALRARCARLLPDTELVEYYGSAECSLIALRRGDGPLRPLPGVDVRVRDDELEIRTTQAVAGRMRHGRLEPAGEALRIGDRGSVSADGGLVVHGRGSATISSGGALVAAEEVEQVLRAVSGVRDVVVAGTPHERLGALVTAVVEAPRGSPSLRALRAAARDGLAPGKRPRRWLVTDALPRLASGKVARAAVAAGLVEGTLDARPIPAGPDPATTAADDTDAGAAAPTGPDAPATADKIVTSGHVQAIFGREPTATADHGRGEP